MYNPQNLARNLKKIRKMHNMTQNQLAEMLFATPQNVSKWETGISAPDVEKLCEIAHIFGTSADTLLGITGNRSGKAVIAIDGGGTKTEFLVFGENGEIFGNFVLRGSNPNSVGMEIAYEILKNGIDSVLEKNVNVTAVYAGIAGTASGNNKKTLLKMLKNCYRGIDIDIESDIINTFYGTGEGGDGIAAICGTGSVVYTKENDCLRRFGGWGYLLGEAGSGYSIGRDFLREALAQGDGIRKKTILSDLAKARLNGDIWANLDKIYSSGKDFIASFSKTAYEAYKAGDKNAEKIFAENAEGLAFFINEAAKSFPHGCGVILSGSVIRDNEFFREALCEGLKPGLTAIIADTPPIIGAAAYGLKLFGNADCNFFDTLKKNYIRLREDNNA